ncbi:SDR family oxidoreductase [Siccirubricoccus sp. G192]|uniref:SDR family oxidoreductase n=1 Tax=Siccirubricoccus sp. G192 TaxID=2849651 RepID=UPI00281106EF|nr:SDR family oxidoreductase [Siccirubricoccus sp. G192]
MVGFTKSLAIELGPERIRVNAILPGLVAGDRIRRVIEAKAQAKGISFAEQEAELLRAVSLRCYVTPQDITNMALYLCSPFGAAISGQALAVDGDMQSLI